MEHPLDGFFAKLGRAKQQTEELLAEHDAFVSNAYRSWSEPDPEGSSYHIVIGRHKEPPLEEWGVITGEIVHDLRSALDNMAYALAGNSASRWTGFPITDCRNTWKSQTGGGEKSKVFGMPPKAVRAIERLQPYHGGYNHRLALLRDLSDWDKHRVLQLSQVTGTVTGTRVEGRDWEVRLILSNLGSLADFEHGAIVARISPGPAASEEVSVNPDVAVAIVFDEGTGASERPVIGTLRGIASFVETEVFIATEEFFPPLPPP